MASKIETTVLGPVLAAATSAAPRASSIVPRPVLHAPLSPFRSPV